MPPAWSLYYLERYRVARNVHPRQPWRAELSPVPGGHGLVLPQARPEGRRAGGVLTRAANIGPNDEIVREGLRRASL
jgi:hypothetical protein